MQKVTAVLMFSLLAIAMSGCRDSKEELKKHRNDADAVIRQDQQSRAAALPVMLSNLRGRSFAVCNLKGVPLSGVERELILQLSTGGIVKHAPLSAGQTKGLQGTDIPVALDEDTIVVGCNIITDKYDTTCSEADVRVFYKGKMVLESKFRRRLEIDWDGNTVPSIDDRNGQIAFDVVKLITATCK
jgi:hypothetical protein